MREHGNGKTSRATLLVPALRCALFAAGGLLLASFPLPGGRGFEAASRWWPLLCVAVNLVTILVLAVLARREGLGLRALWLPEGAARARPGEYAAALPLMVVLGSGGLVAFSVLVYGYMPLANSQPLPPWAAVLALLLLPPTIVLAEIPFYLGYCAPRLKPLLGSETLALAYPLFFFALQHSFMPLLPDWRHLLSRFLQFIPLLAMLGLWSRRRKDLRPLMLGHGVLDVMASAQILAVSLSPGFYEALKGAAAP